MYFAHLQEAALPQSISQTRRRNLLLQLQIFSHRHIDSGHETGSLTLFASRIGVHKSLLSKLKGEGQSNRDISDALARQIESALDLPILWMDEVHEDAPMTTAEQSFLDLCLLAYRATNAAGRSRMRRTARDVSLGAEPP
jgi:hypothetical protein